MKDLLDDRIEALLDRECWVIDMLPERVPAGCGGSFFAVDDYWYESGAREALSEGFFNIALKLSCYYGLDAFDGDELFESPSPEDLRRLVLSCAHRDSGHLWLLLGGDAAMITMDAADLNMCVYGPDARLCGLLEKLALSEGLFFWKADD